MTNDDYERLLDALNNCLDVQFEKESLPVVENDYNLASSSAQNFNQYGTDAVSKISCLLIKMNTYKNNLGRFIDFIRSIFN